MKEDTKRAFERAQFENFLHVSGQSFEGFRNGRPKVEPDMVATKNGKSFGIEITSYHREESKLKESEETKAVEAALRIYEESPSPKVGVHFLWAPHYRATKANREKLARAIAMVIQQNIPTRRQWIDLDWRNFSRDLMVALDSISVDRLIDYTANFWTCGGGGFVPEWDARTLQAEIDRKDGKPNGYRIKYEETWLVMVSGFGSPSSWMEMTDTVATSSSRWKGCSTTPNARSIPITIRE